MNFRRVRDAATTSLLLSGMTACSPDDSINQNNTMDIMTYSQTIIPSQPIVRLDAAIFARDIRLNPEIAYRSIAGARVIFRGRVVRVDTEAHTLSVLIGSGKNVVELFPTSEEQQAAGEVVVGELQAISCGQVIGDNESVQANDCSGFD